LALNKSARASGAGFLLTKRRKIGKIDIMKRKSKIPEIWNPKRRGIFILVSSMIQ